MGLYPPVTASAEQAGRDNLKPIFKAIFSTDHSRTARSFHVHLNTTKKVVIYI